MSASKLELRAQIKMLRAQFVELEEKCKKREDKLVNFVLILEPFLNALSPEIHKQILDTLDT